MAVPHGLQDLSPPAELAPLAVKAQNSNHSTTRKFPKVELILLLGLNKMIHIKPTKQGI